VGRRNREGFGWPYPLRIEEGEKGMSRTKHHAFYLRLGGERRNKPLELF